jgi:hypothetical protein
VPRVFADDLNASPARPGAALYAAVVAVVWVKRLRRRE